MYVTNPVCFILMAGTTSIYTEPYYTNTLNIFLMCISDNSTSIKYYFYIFAHPWYIIKCYVQNKTHSINISI